MTSQRLVDSRAPLTVRSAALLICIATLLEFSLRLFPSRSAEPPVFLSGMLLRALIALVVGLLIAWLVARLNGLAYWLTVLTTGFGVAMALLAGLRAAVYPGSHSRLEWPSPMVWVEVALLVGAFVLLLLRPSMKAPWSMTNGFTGP